MFFDKKAQNLKIRCTLIFVTQFCGPQPCVLLVLYIILPLKERFMEAKST